jgi:large conductance mechanosensitive channel
MIIAFAIFMVVKAINKASKKKTKVEETQTPVVSPDIELLTEIRDLLKK